MDCTATGQKKLQRVRNELGRSATGLQWVDGWQSWLQRAGNELEQDAAGRAMVGNELEVARRA